MSADNRSVHTDALATLGTIITDGGRDAIHLAVEPAIAGELLTPAEDVSFENGTAYASEGKMVGIVDPFLVDYVQPGQKFWLIVYPRQITSLRHVWTHPDFPENSTMPAQVIPDRISPAARDGAERWLRQYCTIHDCPNFDEVMDNFRAGNADDDEYFHIGGSDAGGVIDPEFWDMMEIYLGRRITNRPTHFSCSC